MKNRIRIYSLFLILIFSAISITSVFMIQSNREKSLVLKLSRGFLSNNAVSFSGDLTFDHISKVVDSVSSLKGTAVSIRCEDEKSAINAVIIKGETGDTPMISGRYFEEKDFNCGKRVAVIGQSQKDRIVDINGKKYVFLYNKQYEVIGIMGYHIISPIDDMILVNMDSLEISDNVTYKKLIIDGEKDFTTTKDEVLQKLKNAGISLSQIDVGVTGVSQIISTAIQDNILYLLVFICYILSSVSISFEWIIRKRQLIAIKRLVGVSNKRLIAELFFAYSVHAIAGIIIGLSWYVFIYNGNLSINLLFYMTASTFVCGWLITIPAILKMLRISVSEVMR